MQKSPSPGLEPAISGLSLVMAIAIGEIYIPGGPKKTWPRKHALIQPEMKILTWKLVTAKLNSVKLLC